LTYAAGSNRPGLSRRFCTTFALAYAGPRRGNEYRRCQRTHCKSSVAPSAALRDDKQGLGLTKRNKKRFATQQLLTMLGTRLAERAATEAGALWDGAHGARCVPYSRPRTLSLVWAKFRYLLIDFSDCEGAIGPQTAQVLAQ
jgi:hypothetical protein